MSAPETGTVVEGVGDEVFHVLGIVIFVAVSFLFAYLNRRNEGGEIHPDNVARVWRTRHQLGLADNTEEAAHPGRRERQNGVGSDALQEAPPQRFNADTFCPICLQEKECAAETNCGHVFCGNCLIAYWRHGSWLGAISCPVCRQIVTIIVLMYQDGEQDTDEGRRVSAEIRDYNRRFSGEPRPLMDYIYDLPMLLRHAAREFFSPHGFVWMFRLRIVMCFVAVFVYLISPLDIIPEAVFGVLGFFDDLLIILIMAIYVSVIYRNIVAARMDN